MSSLTSRSLGPTHELGTLVINDDGYWLDLFITDLFEYGTGVECSFSGIDHGGKFGFCAAQGDCRMKTGAIVDSTWVSVIGILIDLFSDLYSD